MHLAKKRIPRLALACLCGFAALAGTGYAQTDQQPVQRPLGTITAIQGNTITLKTDSGAEVSVQVQDTTKIVRVEPGQKSLQGATPVQLQDLQMGDRILARGAGESKSVLASSIILMKHSDIQQKQQQEQQEWQRGVGGLVKTVDTGAGTITLSSGVGPTAKTVTIHTSKDTVVHRYAAASVKYSDSVPASLDQIKPGDQLRARGTKSADGSELTAQEIVSGSFRNIAGMISLIDPAANEVTVMDLITKKPVTVKVTADSQLKKLPPMVAQMMAMRLKGGAPGAAPGSASGAGGASQGGTGAVSPAPAAGQGQWAHGGTGGGAAGAAGSGQGGAGGWRSRGGDPDFQQMLNRMPACTLADLQKGNAVMIVSSAGTESVTALTLLSGVEPILTASPGGNQSAAAAMMSGWTLGGGGGGQGGGDAGQGPG
jgi:Domain of unknown function (DUF5666)